VTHFYSFHGKTATRIYCIIGLNTLISL